MDIRINKKFIAITLAISQAMTPISYVLSLSDIMTRTIVKDVEIDNQPPLADLGAIQKKKVDIVFTTDRNIIGLNEKIDQFVKATINAKGGDVLDTSIATVETTTVSTNDGDAKKIFDSWQSFPQVNSWGYDSVNKVVYNNDNPPWETGFYDPTKFESKDFKMESEIYSNQPAQPIGLMFKLHPSTSYADRYNMYYWWASGSHAVLFKVENAKINDPRDTWSGTYSSTPLLSFLYSSPTYEGFTNTAAPGDYNSGSWGSGNGIKKKSEGGTGNITGTNWDYYAKARYIDLGRSVNISEVTSIDFNSSSGPAPAMNPVNYYISNDGVNWTYVGTEVRKNISKDQIPINDFRYVKATNATCLDAFYFEIYKEPKYEYKLGWPAHEPYDYGGFPHMTSLQKGVQVSNLADPIMKTTVMDFIPVNHTQGWHKMAVQMEGSKIKSTFDSEVIETIDSNPYEKGSMGFFQYSHVGPLFKNIIVESSNTKTLDEALKTHTWRDGSYRFVVNIDETLKSLGYNAGNFNSVSYMKILSKLINDKIGYIGIADKSLKVPTKKVISDNNEYGYYADINSEINEFNFTGSPQEVSLAPGKYKFEAWGANGGRSIRYSNLPGGRGGYTSAILDLKEETNFNVYVGGVGGGGGLNGDAVNDTGGYNGGGSIVAGQSAYGAPGGGATDFRLKGGNWYDFDSLTSRVLVAGGGGGANTRDGDNPAVPPMFTTGYGRGKGGDGGGAAAAYGLTENQDAFGLNHGYTYGSGGSQSMGGITHYYRNGSQESERTTGIFGGGHVDNTYGQSGGGGGYYGGANSIHGGGGGGSSFVTGASSCDLTYRYLHKNLSFSSVVMETGDASNPAVIDARNGNGFARITKVVGEATGLDAALLNSANYIISEINKSTVANTKYMILNSDLKYNITYSDYENDIPVNLNDFNFRYQHDENYFENSLGRIPNNNQWISSLIKTFAKNTEVGNEHQWLSGSTKYFDKVGKYLVEYRTKDDPIPGEDNFSEYRKYSSMPTGPLELYVHRKPLAEAKFKITKTNPTMTVNFTSLAYDLDHESLANKGIRAKEWWYKQLGAVNWINGGTADTFQFTGNMTTDYIVKHKVQDIDGELGIGVWNEKEYLVTSKSLPPVASFTVNPTTYPVRSALSITDASYDPNGDAIIEEVWNLYDPSGTLRYQKVLSSPTGVTQAQVNVVSTEVKNMIDAQGHSAYGKWTLTQQLRDSSGSWLDPLAVSDLVSKTITVTPNNGAPNISISPTDVLIDGLNIADTDNITNPLNRFITWGLNATDPDIDNKGFVYKWELEHRENKDGRVIKSIADKDATDKIRTYNYNSNTPFENKSFKEQNLSPGPYSVTANIIDIPTYGEPASASITKRFYVVPTMTGTSQIIHDKSEVICGDTVKLRVNTDYITEKVVVEVLGTTLDLVKVSENGNNAVWELDYIIPELADTQDVNFKFTLTTFFGSQDIYGNTTTPTRTKTINQTINVVALKLEDFRITDMVNHDFFSYSFPIFRDKMPVDYIAGYYVTLQVDAKGNPEQVISKVSTDGGLTSTNLEFKLVGNNGTKGIWEAKYFLDNKSAIGTVVTNDLTAYKNTTSYNYNTKEVWNGETLKVVSGLEKDIIIKRTN